MTHYDKKILDALIDSYENSLLSRGENRVAVHISYRFSRSTVPEYFNESSGAFEEIHAAMYELESRGFIDIQWKNGTKGHIIQKVVLDAGHVQEVYSYLKRTPRSEYIGRQKELLRRLGGECGTPVAGAFISWMEKRLDEGLTVREYTDISDTARTERLIRCVNYIENNNRPYYFREFSILHFNDTKAFEAIKGTVKKIFSRFGEGLEDADEKEIFAEYGLYDTPNYVYLKGEAILRRGRDEFPLYILDQGIGLSGEDLDNIYLAGTEDALRVITIENLTSFFQYREDNSIIIYLGGYHNRARRRLLKMLHEQLPDADYLHFGDIDAGGFAIYEDLCRKTGISFRTFHMGIEELDTYRKYARPLTDNDRKRLTAMLGREDGCRPAYSEVLQYMLEQDIKLEQECVGACMGRAEG